MGGRGVDVGGTTGRRDRRAARGRRAHARDAFGRGPRPAPAHAPAGRQVFAGHEGEVSCGVFTTDGTTIVSGSSDGTVRVWAPKKGVCKHVFRKTATAAFHEVCECTQARV